MSDSETQCVTLHDRVVSLRDDWLKEPTGNLHNLIRDHYQAFSDDLLRETDWREGELRDQIEQLRAENAKLWAALEKYADERNWEMAERKDIDFDTWTGSAGCRRGPQIAQAALKGGE